MLYVQVRVHMHWITSVLAQVI